MNEDSYDTLSLNELSEIIAASEQNRDECAKISTESHDKYQITVKCSRSIRSKTAIGSSLKQIDDQILTRQRKLLNSQLYQAHSCTDRKDISSSQYMQMNMFSFM